jgi:hypothetical protein
MNKNFHENVTQLPVKKLPYSEGRTGKILDEDLISMDRIRVSKNSNFDLALTP